MKCLAIAGLLLLACRPAAAITCDDVRTYVKTYGVVAVLAYVKRIGATPAQIREGRACLRHNADNEIRSASREMTIER
jgi:hypothetical protein